MGCREQKSHYGNLKIGAEYCYIFSLTQQEIGGKTLPARMPRLSDVFMDQIFLPLHPTVLISVLPLKTAAASPEFTRVWVLYT